MNTEIINSDDKEYLEKFLEGKKEILKTILNFKEKIKELNKEEKKVNRVIWNLCNHDWVLDVGCSSDDLCKRYCSKCNLKQFKKLYI